MNWRVVKTGTDPFDILHAYGLAILVAFLARAVVDIWDEGLCYRLSCRREVRLRLQPRVLRAILALPSDITPSRLCKPAKNDTQLANLDGLLAALFTVQGPRCVSVSDVAQAISGEYARPEMGPLALAKVRHAVERWEKYVARCNGRSSKLGLGMAESYDPVKPTIPIPVAADPGGDGVNVLMTLDPSYSISTRRVHSDGQIGRKTNITFSDPVFAPILAFVGASRFLRAQRVAHGFVNLYVPIAEHMEIGYHTAVPILSGAKLAAEGALAMQALSWLLSPPFANMNGIAYQVLETQGSKQSASRARGRMDLACMAEVEASAGENLIRHWTTLLRSDVGLAPRDLANLVHFLIHRQGEMWEAHLLDIALWARHLPRIREYALAEVAEVTRHMVANTGIALSSVLDNKRGTLRFGHALRLLGRFSPSTARDITSALRAVRDRAALLLVLGQIAQECAVAKAQTKRMRVPDDEDLRQLLLQIEAYPVHEIAALIIVLSSLYYPPRISREALAPDEVQQNSAPRE